MGEENAGFEDGPICGALIEFRKGGGGGILMRGRDDRCRPGVVQGNLHANVHCSAKDVEIFLSDCTSRLVGPSHTNPGTLYLKRIMRKLPPANSCSRRKNLKVQRKPLWKVSGSFPQDTH